MRISDWSSDVCSSDLSRPRANLGKPSQPVFQMPGVGQLPIGDVMKFVGGHLKGFAGGRDAEPIAAMRTRNRSTPSAAAARADDLVTFDLGAGNRSLETVDPGFHALTHWVVTGSERNFLPILGDGFV